MSSDQSIADIVAQLNQLQLQQSELLTQLTGLSGRNAIPVVVDGTQSEFQVGDSVRILNPRGPQANTGVISKISANRITVTTASGSKIIRAYHNIALLPF